MQNEILATEKVLLEALRFDLIVELPYIYLLRYFARLQGYLLSASVDDVCGNIEKNLAEEGRVADVIIRFKFYQNQLRVFRTMSGKNGVFH